MGFITGLLDRSILVGGILAGGTIPSFIAQYRQRLGGHLDQALRDLKPFEEVARQFHGGDLQALIRHHKASSDPSFRQEGQAIEAMQQAILSLRDALQALQGNLVQQVEYLATRADKRILQATWDAFQPAFAFNLEGATTALAVGGSLWLVFMALSWVVGRAFRPRARPSSGRSTLRKVK